MHRIKINKELNRLYMTISGFIKLKDAAEIIDDLESYLKLLKHDYDIIIDIRNVKPTNVYVLNQIKVGTDLFEQYGIRNTIFVVGSSKYALTMFAKFVGYNEKELIYFVPSLEIAEEKIIQLTKSEEETIEPDNIENK